MYKIDKSDLEFKTPVPKRGKGAYSPIYAKTIMLEVGEILWIGREDWKGYGYKKGSTPQSLISARQRDPKRGATSKPGTMSDILTSRKFTYTGYEDGWAIERIF